MVFRKVRQTAAEQEQAAEGAEERVPSAGNWRVLLHQVSTDLFLGTLALHVILLLIEMLRRQSVSYFINLGVIFWIIAASGTVAILTAGGEDPPGAEGRSARKERRRPVLAVLTCLMGCMVVLLAAWRLGSVSLLLSLGMGLLLILVAPGFT